MQNLIIWEAFDYIELFILAFLPMLYKLLFWLYTIQLKEYRWDRFKEYLLTNQGKTALFSVFSIVEFVLFIVSALIWIPYFIKTPYLVTFWGTFYHIFFWFLVIENIFVLWKLFRKRILKPKLTSRIIILILLFIIWWGLDLYFFYKWNLWNFTYLYILAVYLFMPFIIFFYNFISLPIVNYKKNKIIKSAIRKSGKINNPPTKIAITWSYWKTSVKEFLSQILSNHYKVLKTPENINTELWVSSVVLNRLSSNYDFFVAEIWAYRIWEIETLWKIVNHKYWFLTAIWNQHIGLFGSQENIIKWKFEILKKVEKNNWFLYVNADNEFIEKYLENINTTNIIRYWINSSKACAKSKIIELKNWKTSFEFSYNWVKEIFETNLIWEHNILNLTWILAFLVDIWLNLEDIKNDLLNLKLPKWSWEIIEIPHPNPLLWEERGQKVILIDDTYNLSEASLKAGLQVLNSFSWEKILVLDDILELGDKAEMVHYNLAKEIGEKKLANKVLFVWVNYKEIFEKGLIDSWFDKKNILSTDGFNHLKNAVILFEWKKAKKYLDILKKS